MGVAYGEGGMEGGRRGEGSQIIQTAKYYSLEETVFLSSDDFCGWKILPFGKILRLVN